MSACFLYSVWRHVPVSAMPFGCRPSNLQCWSATAHKRLHQSGVYFNNCVRWASSLYRHWTCGCLDFNSSKKLPCDFNILAVRCMWIVAVAENPPEISFSRSNMALVASCCSQLTWLFWPWESSPLCKVPWSFPFALLAPQDSLQVSFSFLLGRELKCRHDGPSVLSPCKPPLWLRCGDESESCGSSSPVFFVEASDSWDLDRVSPLKIILKWEVKGLSWSSFLSWEPFSSADSGSFSVSAFSGGSEGGSKWEITIVGIEGAPKGGAVDSGFEDGVTASFGASVWGLELCRGNRNNHGCVSC